ncbi:hypothetical protein VNO77_02182 [Canavalia gladiata]|uniref:Uncharacterized protein n=1 Tax=Canavalia gladiata TaxID=3824 RepID=A0AAN9R2T6_CANGL
MNVLALKLESLNERKKLSSYSGGILPLPDIKIVIDEPPQLLYPKIFEFFKPHWIFVDFPRSQIVTLFFLFPISLLLLKKTNIILI